MSFLPALAAAGPCDATFNFDGNLADASGNVQDGVMIAAGGIRAKPVFVPGRSGQALSLEGTSAMRAPLDLHFEVCPQVTISAWIKRTDANPKVTQYVLKTGSGSGPGIRVSGSRLALNGPANGLFRTNVIRSNAGWQFVAGVYDYAAGTFQMYYGFRGGKAQNMGAVKPGEDAFWVGAWNDSLTAPATGIQVDDVRIIGSALNKEQVYALQKQPPGVPSGGQSEPTEIPGAQAQVPLSGQISADGTDGNLTAGRHRHDEYEHPGQRHAGRYSGHGRGERDTGYRLRLGGRSAGRAGAARARRL